MGMWGCAVREIKFGVGGAEGPVEVGCRIGVEL